MKSFVDETISQNLISGFISAIDNFSQETLSFELYTIELKHQYLSFQRSKMEDGTVLLYVLITNACLKSNDIDDCYCIPTTLDTIVAEFKKRYGHLNFSKVINIEEFTEFSPYVEQLVAKFFNVRFCLDTTLNDFKQSKTSSQTLLGFFFYKNQDILNYGASKKLKGIRLYLLESNIRLWSRLAKYQTTSEYVKQNTELDKFTVMFSSKKATDPLSASDTFYLFSFWKKVPQHMFDDLHRSLFMGLIKSHIPTKISQKKEKYI